MRVHCICCLLMFLLSTISQYAQAEVKEFCFDQAGSRYGISPSLLKAIAITESSLRPNIESPTQDIGLMGINRSWLKKLKKEYGISEAEIWQPCTNINIGAWILANNFKRFGVSWNAVGAYSASCSKLKGINCINARYRYSRRIWQNLQKL